MSGTRSGTQWIEGWNSKVRDAGCVEEKEAESRMLYGSDQILNGDQISGTMTPDKKANGISELRPLTPRIIVLLLDNQEDCEDSPDRQGE